MHSRISIYCFLFAVVVSVCAACAAPRGPVAQPGYWPSDEWRASTPEEQGVDSAAILAMLQAIENKNLNLHSLLIVRHGYLITEVYYPPYQQDYKHPVFSVTKSVTSAMVGKAIEQGHIKGVQQKVLDSFPDIARDVTDQKLKDMTVEHLLTMSAGFNTTTFPKLDRKDASFDTVRHILTYDSILQPPGKTFFYDTGLPHVLSAIVQQGTGMTLRTYAEQKLFQPLGIADATWSADPRGVTLGQTGLLLRPRDMAKIGYLYLQRGEWNGAQLLPEAWVETSTAKHIETRGLMNAAEDDGYGYLWWMDSFGGYSAHGFGGQFVFVLPRLDMVIVMTGGLSDPLFPTPKQLVQSFLIPAAQATAPLPPNAQAFQSLQQRIELIERGEPSTAPLPKTAAEISGKTFRITPKQGGGWAEAVTLTFRQGTFDAETLWPGNGRMLLTGSLNQVYHLNQVQFPGTPPQNLRLPMRGHWQDDATFITEYIEDLNTEIDGKTQKFTFAGDRVTIEVSSSMGGVAGQAVGELVK